MNCRSAVLLVAAAVPSALAQEPKERPQPPRQPPLVSPEVGADRTVTFRLRAPSATAVRLEGGDMPGLGRGAALTKGDNGLWQHTVGPLPAGAYRYVFNVDGVRVVDPVNPATSESNATTWGLVVVPGSELFDLRDVPHGAVAQVNYFSKSLQKPRRMHVYTPPGYEKGDEKYPVFYLLHGASDSDASWSTVGRAGVILDNLIAAHKAVPMIVVMPAGHVGRFGAGAGGGINREVDQFTADFVNDVKPYVESHYRVRADRASRAIAGLSMGGAQTLEVAVRHLPDYGYVGVFSSGVFSLVPRGGGAAPAGPGWEERHKAALDDPEQKKGLKLVWFAIGKDDFLLDTSRATVKLLRGHGFEVDVKETEGGHTWLNWRDYLAEFAGRLFHDGAAE
jgi:enterochelin esterase-like enzyme